MRKLVLMLNLVLVLTGYNFAVSQGDPWDNTLPSDAMQWNDAALSIRNNNDAIETALGVDLAGGVAVYNVKGTTYGALGDGSNDDKDEIQAAIDAATAAGGGIVWFPEGTYMLSGKLVLKSNVTLQGEGWSSILKLEAGANSDLIEFNFSGGDVTDVAILDLQLDGDGSNQSAGNNKIIEIVDGIRVRVENCYIHDTKNDAIGISADLTSTNRHIWIVNNYMKTVGVGGSGARSGISIIEGRFINILGNRIEDVDQNFIDLEPTTDDRPVMFVNIIDNICETADGVGIQLKVAGTGTAYDITKFAHINIVNNVVKDFDTDNNTAGGIINTGFVAVNIKNNHVTQAATNSAGISAGRHANVEGNYIYNCESGIDVGTYTNITGNTIDKANLFGIRSNSAADPEAKYVTISHNLVKNTQAGPAVRVDSSQEALSVIGNTLIDDQSPATTTYGIWEEAGGSGTNNTNIYTDNIIKNMLTAPTFIRSRKNIVDLTVTSQGSVDLSGSAARSLIFTADRDYHLINVDMIYTEASDPCSGVDLAIGKAGSDEFYFTTTSAINKSIWDRVSVINANNSDPCALFASQTVSADETMFLYTAGGKTGTGEVAARIYLMPVN